MAKFRRYSQHKKRAGVSFELAGDQELVKALQAISFGANYDMPAKVLLEASRPMEAAVRLNAPDSRKTGSRKKQSRKTKALFSSSKPLHTTITTVTRQMRRYGVVAGSYALVGPSYTHGGGHGNFFASQHKDQQWWGKPARASRIVNQFVKRAADQTKDQCRSVMVAAIKRELDALAKKAVRNG